jgi:hypothetical protein
MMHACVDYPFPRPAVSGWLFAMLALLYTTRLSTKSSQQKVEAPLEDEPPVPRPA